MIGLVLRRLLYMVPMLAALSALAFAVMQLQPGDFLTKYQLTLSQETLEQLRARYGLDQAPWVQYLRWVRGIVTRGDFGFSFETRQPVFDYLFISGNRLGWTLLLIALTMAFSWLVAVPIGIYSATHKYSLGDHTITALGFVGLSLPNFFTALLILWLLVAVFQVGSNYGLGVGGLFDVELVSAPWSWAKFWNFLWHLWPAVLVIGTANLAQLIRTMRAHLLDVLSEPYVQTARAKGLSERVVIWKHAVRNAINPLISILGFWIPFLFEGTLVAAVVLQLPVVERAYWRALVTEDQYVVMSGLLFFGFVLLVGNLLADVLLALANPKIRYD